MGEEEKYAIQIKKWGWFFGAVLAATGLQWQFPQLRGSSFTAEDGRLLETRISELESRVNNLPPRPLLDDVSTMKGDIRYISNMLEQIQRDLERE